MAMYAWSPGGAYQFSVATGGHDDRGGLVIHRSNGRLANPVGRVDFQFGDNYVPLHLVMIHTGHAQEAAPFKLKSGQRQSSGPRKERGAG